MAGHVIHFRTRLLSLVGVPRDFPWGSRFDTGSKVGSAESYPEPAELVAMWEELSELLVEQTWHVDRGRSRGAAGCESADDGRNAAGGDRILLASRGLPRRTDGIRPKVARHDADH